MGRGIRRPGARPSGEMAQKVTAARARRLERLEEPPLALGAGGIVLAAGGESVRIPPEIALLEGVDHETRTQLEGDPLGRHLEGVELGRVERGAVARREALARRGEDLEIDARGRRVLARPIAPRAPGIAELHPERAAHQGVEVDEGKRPVAAGALGALEEEIRQKTERKETDDLPALKQKLRLLQLIADRTDDAVDQIEQLPPAEREAFKQLMFALTTWLSPDDARRSSLRNAKILRSLQEVNNRLSSVSKLDLKNLMFCEKVESFGWYTEFQRAEFAPKQQVILYVEVQNFASRPFVIFAPASRKAHS